MGQRVGNRRPGRNGARQDGVNFRRIASWRGRSREIGMRPPGDCGGTCYALRRAGVCVAGARSRGEDRAIGGERHNAKIENGKRHAGNEALGVNTVRGKPLAAQLKGLRRPSLLA